MESIQEIRIRDVVVPQRKRSLVTSKVDELADSIRHSGLLQPIVITTESLLVHGHHRLEAARKLGWESIAAIVRDLTALERELAEIDENLIRADLSVLERAEHLARREEILLETGQRAIVGQNQHSQVGSAPGAPPQTTADLAEEIGLSERSAQEHLQIARGISSEVRDSLRGTPLAEGTKDLLRLARIKDPGKQRAAAERALKEGLPVSSAVRLLGHEARRRCELVAPPGESPKPQIEILIGDVLEVLPTRPSDSAHACITSPPYWGLRDYGVEGQLGREETFEEWLELMVRVFAEVHRVLRLDGTLWLNVGDSFAGRQERKAFGDQSEHWCADGDHGAMRKVPQGCKAGDLVAQAWRLALALRDWGWYLRSDIIWWKPNALPESVRSRPTRAHEYLFLLSKAERYFYDSDNVREPLQSAPHVPGNRRTVETGGSRIREEQVEETWGREAGRNLRDVWSIATEPFPGAHFATFPTELARRCIEAGTSQGGACPSCGAPWLRGDTTGEFETIDAESNFEPGCSCRLLAPVPCLVLDPFLGSGSTGLAAHRLGRSCLGIELNPKYAELARRRIFGAPEATEGGQHASA